MSKPAPKQGNNSNAPDAPVLTWYKIGIYDELVSPQLHPAPQWIHDSLINSVEIQITRGRAVSGLGYIPLQLRYRDCVFCVGQDGYYPFYKTVGGAVFGVTTMKDDNGNDVVLFGLELK